jgi:hypothetical protein
MLLSVAYRRWIDDDTVGSDDHPIIIISDFKPGHLFFLPLTPSPFHKKSPAENQKSTGERGNGQSDHLLKRTLL